MQTLSYYFRDPPALGTRLLVRYGDWLPDKTFLKLKYRLVFRKKLDLKCPKTFSEKLQWLKLYDRCLEYTIMVDKVKAKEYVASVLGEEYIIPTLGVWDDADKIDFNTLPDRFVIKCNHNSGLGMYICRDKSKMDIRKVRENLKRGLKQDYFVQNREWPYKNVPRRILAEQFMEPDAGAKDLADYKWFCFNGEPKYCQVIQDRTTKETIDFFDTNWIHQEFVGLNPAAGPAAVPPAKPTNLDLHIQIARRLAKGIPFSRIDLYEVDGRVYFGEITFFPFGGMGMFNPEQYDEILGQMIMLPNEKLLK